MQKETSFLCQISVTYEGNTDYHYACRSKVRMDGIRKQKNNKYGMCFAFRKSEISMSAYLADLAVQPAGRIGVFNHIYRDVLI